MADQKLPEFIASTLPPPQQWRGRMVWRPDLGVHQWSDGAAWNSVASVSGYGIVSLDLTGTGATTAAANAAAILAAAQSSRTVRLRNPSSGTVAAYCNPVRLPSGTRVLVDEGLVWRRADSVNAPMVKGQNTGQLLPGTKYVRTGGNLVTVSNRFHGLTVGRQVWVGNLTDTTMNGIQTVASVLDAHTWTYASAGSNGSGGASTNFSFLIPLNRTIAGASFVAASDVVTVTDPGHDLRPGMHVWLGTTGASTAFVGEVEVIAVWPGFWQYYKSGSGTGAATGTIAICYERDIIIDGYGALDGNAVNNGTTQDTDTELSLVSFGMLNQSRFSIKQAGSTIFRAFNLNNPADVVFDGVEYYDTLVGTQVEASGTRVRFMNCRGGTGKWVSGPQLVDDAVAFTGTKLIGGAAYDNSCSPYGLGNFLDCGVYNLDAPTCLNGVKLTADASVYIDNLTVDGITGGMANFNVTPFTGSAGVRYVDDSASLKGMVCGRLYVRRIKWTGGSNAFQWLCSGTADLLDINGVEYSTPATQAAAGSTYIGSAINIASSPGNSGGKIKTLRYDNVVTKSQAANKPCVILGSLNTNAVDTFRIDQHEVGKGCIFTVGGSFSSGSGIIKYGNCSIGHSKVSATFVGPDSGTGHTITAIAPNIGTWELDEMVIVDGGVTMSYLFVVAVSDSTVSDARVVVRGGKLKTVSGIADNSSAVSGTITVILDGADTSNITNNLLNMNAATAAITLLASTSSIVPADKVIGTVAGGATLRVNGPSIKLAGSKVTAPAVGDMFWSTDTSTSGSASIGMKARTNAGAWTALF